jgi:integrase
MLSEQGDRPAASGLRSQAALQLAWRDVNFHSGVMYLVYTKSEKVRAVPMHKCVDALLFDMWHAAGKLTRGSVMFLSAAVFPTLTPEAWAATRSAVLMRPPGRRHPLPIARLASRFLDQVSVWWR